MTVTPNPVLLLAHGAGAGMNAPFMRRMDEALIARGVAVHRFNFAYMQKSEDTGRRQPPARVEKLVEEYRAVIAALEPQGPVVIGGKSMGGRVAAMLAALPDCPARVRGVVCLGYPLHAPSTPDKMRLPPLMEARLPVLVCQGERDVFGPRETFEALALPALIRLIYLHDGSHDLGPTGKSDATLKGNIALAADAVADFVKDLTVAPDQA